jgi:predicted small secreted protein
MSIARFLPVVLLLALGACNTMQGMGEDVSTAGQTLESEAAETEAQM